MSVLGNYEPSRVMHYFEEICGIPHGSTNTKAISDYLVQFAINHPKLRYRQDELGNVIMWKDGCADASRSPVILQGHMDMVCDKDPSIAIDMDKEPLQIFIEGDNIKANGTTLGGDDGIAVAMALAILEDDSLNTPPLEAIFTVDEEIGMIGAAGIDVSDIKGKMLINIDSEAEGILTVSCAGGADAKCILPLNYEEVSGPIMNINISGLTGGHSGVEIDKNRANANVLLGRCLQAISADLNIRIVALNGGAKSNAIPVNANAQIVLLDIAESDIKDTVDKAVGQISDITNVFKDEFRLTDPSLTVVCSPLSKDMSDSDDRGKCLFDAKAMDKATTEKIIYMLTCLPNGITRMSPANPSFVQTSLNLGIVEINEKALILTYCVRSSVDSEKKDLLLRLKCAMEIIGGEVETTGDYPGWEYKEDSALRDACVNAYVEQYGKEPLIESIHAGLECGYFASKIPGLDCVSLGPNMKDIHTCRETMSISSVQRVYKMVLNVLEKLA